MNAVRDDDHEPERDTYTDEPVFDLGDISDDPDPRDERIVMARDIRSPLLEQLSTLFTPAALSLAGLIVAVLAALGPLFGTTALLSSPFGAEPPTGGWAIWPVAVSGAIAAGLGLVAWRLAQATQTEVPRTAGTSVVLGALLLVAALVLWTRPEPEAQTNEGAAASNTRTILASVIAEGSDRDDYLGPA
jgi:hypothetical protein